MSGTISKQIQREGVMADEDQMQADYEAAMEALSDEDMDTARDCLRRMMKRNPDDPRTVELSGDFARLRGDYEKADAFYMRLPTLSGDKAVLAVSLLSRGILYAEQGKRDEACDLLRQAIELYRQIGDAQRMIAATGNLADTLLEAGRLAEAAEAFQSALELAQEDARLEPDPEGDGEGETDDDSQTGKAFTVASLERELGEVCRMLGELDRAATCFRNAMVTFEEADDELEVAETLDCLSVVRQIQGDYDEAESLLRRAIDINEKHDFTDGLSVNYGNMAFLYKHRKNFDEAAIYLEKAHKIDKASGRDEAIADYHIQMGEILYERCKYDEAESNLLKALKMHKQLDNITGIAAAYSHLGALYRHRKDFAQSEKMTLKALEISEELQNLDFIAGVVDELGMLRKVQGRTDEARELWNRALSHFQQLRSAKMTEEVRKQIEELGQTN